MIYILALIFIIGVFEAIRRILQPVFSLEERLSRYSPKHQSINRLEVYRLCPRLIRPIWKPRPRRIVGKIDFTEGRTPQQGRSLSVSKNREDVLAPAVREGQRRSWCTDFQGQRNLFLAKLRSVPQKEEPVVTPAAGPLVQPTPLPFPGPPLLDLGSSKLICPPSPGPYKIRKIC